MNQRRKIDMRMQKVCKIFRWCKMYSMGMTKFQEVAKDAKVCYKIGQIENADIWAGRLYVWRSTL